MAAAPKDIPRRKGIISFKWRELWLSPYERKGRKRYRTQGGNRNGGASSYRRACICTSYTRLRNSPGPYLQPEIAHRSQGIIYGFAVFPRLLTFERDLRLNLFPSARALAIGARAIGSRVGGARALGRGRILAPPVPLGENSGLVPIGAFALWANPRRSRPPWLPGVKAPPASEKGWSVFRDHIRMSLSHLSHKSIP